MLTLGLAEVGKPMGTKGTGKGGKRRPRTEASACSRPAAACTPHLGLPPLAHPAGMCPLHPSLTSLSSASCLKRKPAQIWLKNLTDAFRQRGPAGCLPPADPGVWQQDRVCPPRGASRESAACHSPKGAWDLRLSPFCLQKPGQHFPNVESWAETAATLCPSEPPLIQTCHLTCGAALEAELSTPALRGSGLKY